MFTAYKLNRTAEHVRSELSDVVFISNQYEVGHDAVARACNMVNALCNCVDLFRSVYFSFCAVNDA